MKKEICLKCLCNSCSQNAESYADGLCRECETCEECGNRIIESGCEYYTDDNEVNNFI